MPKWNEHLILSAIGGIFIFVGIVILIAIFSYPNQVGDFLCEHLDICETYYIWLGGGLCLVIGIILFNKAKG